MKEKKLIFKKFKKPVLARSGKRDFIGIAVGIAEKNIEIISEKF